ncbi:LacI family DNA-binding transcriptional regulator [Novosphingobium kaempferiae]|uniref:LacI family DNA-binding transcriptional regulator n=1 Tax=Novosphingobium kaempferiae TaxID=2896849 RepID=UPI001E4E9688|nr:LacI family DNA-binding transcriptional regulator [Novosphingobium kaempferiae]
MTVSRVINGRSGVSPETRAAVKKAIKALAYIPNVAARNLVTSNELRIGVIYSNPSAAFMSDFLTGVFEEASARSARLVLLKGRDGCPPGREAVKEMLASGMSGVLLAPPLGESPEILRTLREAGCIMAAVGAYQTPEAVCVRIDDRGAAYEMTRHLIGQGHKRLGFVLGNPDQAASAERMAGFYAAVREAGGIDVQVVQGDFTYTSGLMAAEQLLNAPVPPTAIFASNDDMAAAVVSVAHRKHLDVPSQLAVAGFDDTTVATTLWPPLTTIRQPVREMAAEAMGMLIAQIGSRSPARPAIERILQHEFVQRQSTMPEFPSST